MSKPEDTSPIESEPEELADPTQVSNVVEADIEGILPREVPAKAESGVAKSAGIVSIAVMFSRVFGLVREVIFAAFFGAGFVSDAFYFAFRIPNLLRDLFAEGALSVAFVKVFTHYQINVSEKEAWRLAAMVFNAIAVVLGIIVILGIFLSPYLVPLLARGFPPEKAQLAVFLTQLMFPFILFVALSAIAMGVLNTKGKFAIPASASTAFNIVSIVVGVIFAHYLSGGTWVIPDDPTAIAEMPAQWAITGMAIGTVFGGIAQIAIQLPSLYRVGFRFKPILDFHDKGIKRVMRLMGPAIIGTSAVQVKVLVDSFIVSDIQGGMTWLPQSFRLMQFPIGIFGVAIGVAALPTLARLGSENNIAKFRSTLSDALGLVFLLTIPSAIGLITLGEPIVRLVYQRGNFKAFDTDMVAWSLAAYSVGLAAYAAIKVLSPAFYALEDAKTPMYVAIVSIIVHVFFSYTLMTYFSTVGVTPARPNGFGHAGVALSTSIVASVNFLALLILMRRKIERIDTRKILKSFVKVTISSIIMSAVCWFSYQFLSDRIGNSTLFARMIETIIPITLGGIVFIISAKLLRVRELDQFVNIFKRKFGKAQ